MRGIRKHPFLTGIAVLVLIGVSVVGVSLWAQEAPQVIVIDPGAAAPGQAGPATVPATTPPPRGTPGFLGPAEIRYPPKTQPTSGQVKLRLDNPTVDAIVNFLGDIGGYIVIKEVPVPNRINAVSPQPMNTEEALAFLDAALKTGGFTAVRHGRMLTITTIEKGKLDAPVHYGAEWQLIPDTDELITQVVPVLHLDATKLKQDLTAMIGTDADVAANAASNNLVITDRASHVRRIVQMIAKLDEPVPGSSNVEVLLLKYADATSAAKLINTVFAPPDQQTTGGGGGGGAGGGGRGGGGGGGGGRGGGGAGGGGPGAFFANMLGGRQNAQDKGGPNLRINAVADDRTNNIVVTGPAEGVSEAITLLKKIDANPSSEVTFFIYSLKNGTSDKLAVVLNQMFGNSTGGTGTSTQQRNTNGLGIGSTSSSFGGSGGGGGGLGGGGGGGGGGLGLGTSGGGTGIGARPGGTTTGTGSTGTRPGGGQASANPLAGQVFVVSNPDTNSLLVTTVTKYADQVKQIIHELDRPVAQVLIKVLIAEVTHDRSDDLGADFSVLNVRASGNGTTLTQQLGNAAANTANGGLAVAVVEKNVTATLHLLSLQNKLDVLSRPYILTSDNQEATITIGNEVPFITNTRQTDTGQTINTIQYQDIGIILDVTPHINQDGLVIMDVTPEISEQTGNGVDIAQGVTAPIFSKRSSASRVGIADGQTIVIGGLFQDMKTTTLTKVPLLGDLPWIGPAFTRYQNDRSKTELLIFLTPHVALQPGALKPMSADELRGTVLTPNTVAPGVFQDHMRGMQRGSTGLPPSTRPDVFVPSSQPSNSPSGILTLPMSVPNREPAGSEPEQPGGQSVFIPVAVPVPAGGTGQ